jgi:GNAT superfamily N-acetyltransferase
MGSNKLSQSKTGPATRISDLDYMALQVSVLYRLDWAGRLRCVNEPHEPPAPCFFMGRTRHGNLWRFRADLPNTLCRELDSLCAAEPVTTDFSKPPANAGAIKAVLSSAAPVNAEYRGPAFWIPPGHSIPTHVVLINETNQHLLASGFPDLLPLSTAHLGGAVAAALVAGAAVAVCHTARITGGAAEAGVETLPAYRGQGHAGAVVVAWAAEVRQSGRVPLYSTWWKNHASQAVARKLDMVFYGEDWSLG